MVARKAEGSVERIVVESADGNGAEAQAHRLQEEVLRRVARFEVNVPFGSRPSVFGSGSLVDCGEDEDRGGFDESLLIEGGAADFAPQIAFELHRQLVRAGLIVKKALGAGEVDLEGIQRPRGGCGPVTFLMGHARRRPQKLREHLRRDGLVGERPLRPPARERFLEGKRPAAFWFGKSHRLVFLGRFKRGFWLHLQRPLASHTEEQPGEGGSDHDPVP